VAEVNNIYKQYLEMKKMMERMKKGGIKSILRNLKGNF